MPPTNQKQQNARSEAPEPAEPVATHILGRSRSSRGFNRAGFRWHPEYQAISLKELELKAAAMTEANPSKPTRVRDLVKAILDEPALDARLVTEEDAKAYEDQRKQVLAEEISPAMIYQAYVAQGARIADLEKKIEELHAEKYGAGDKPPKQGELPAGSMPSTRA